MKYKLNKELSKLSKVKAPLNLHAYPFVNAYLKLFTCKSDDKVNVKKVFIPVEDGSSLKTFVIEPKGCEGPLPCIIFYHGGGFLLRASKSHYQIAKWYAEKTPCKVIFADYRLMPEYRYPVAVNDCYSTYIWAVHNSKELGIDRERIIVAGDSAGANLSVAVSMMLKDKEQDMPAGTMLIYPVLDRRMITESMGKYKDTPAWDAVRNEMFWREYLKECGTESVKYASPMEAESLKGFPRTYIEVAEFDCLHDEGRDFAERLKSEDIVTDFYETNGACHGYDDAFNSLLVRSAVDRRVKWFQSVFGI